MNLRGWGLAWARVLPSVVLIPAFGLQAIPAPARITLGLALAASIAPALTPLDTRITPFGLLFVAELAKGLPVALTAATALWAASMAGGLIDDLRGASDAVALPNVERGSTPMGALFSMLVAIAFLQGGGPARIASTLAQPALPYAEPLLRAIHNLTAGIELAIAVAAPVVAAAIVVEVSGALIARAAYPSFVHPLLAPLRSIAILGAAALMLDRMLELLVLYANRKF